MNEKKLVEEHECSFGFENVGAEKGIYEPKKGHRGFSRKRDDWVCKCGMTRREYLAIQKTRDECEKESKLMGNKHWCIVHGNEKNNCDGCVYEEVKKENNRIREDVEKLEIVDFDEADGIAWLNRDEVLDAINGKKDGNITGILAIGNGEQCPFCNVKLDNRPDHKGEDIQEHLFRNHKKEVMNRLFPKEKKT